HTTPPAVVNSHPAYPSQPETTRAAMQFRPEPTADQLLPAPLAIYLAALPPAVVNKPPAYTSLPDTASANTWSFIPIPEPRADQLLASHLPMLLAALPPAVVNVPPAYTSLPDTASALTNGAPSLALIPDPSADQ